MQTRQRAARQRDSEPRVTEPPAPRASAGREASVSGTSSRLLPLKSRTGSLVGDPIPRRGAPSGFSCSITSIPTRLGNESEDEGEDEIDDESGDKSGDGHAVAQSLRASEESAADGARLQLMARMLPKLSRAADELMTLLENSDSAALEIETDVFHRYFREYYHDTNASLFVDWAPLQDLDSSAASVLARANLVHALDCIRRVSNGDPDTLLFLDELDASFPALFCPLGQDQRHLRLALEIRTCFLVESLAQANKAEFRQTIADIFCERTDEDDYPHLFTHGPFRKLGGFPVDEDQPWLDEVSSRVTQVFTRSWKAKNTAGVALLKKEFPLLRLFNALQEWILGQYREIQKPSHPEPEAPPGQVDEDHHESASSVSQEIVRDNGPDKRESLFRNGKSIMQLEATAHRPSAPPSNQQQATALLNASRAHLLPSAELLRMPTPPNAAARVPGSRVPTSSAGALLSRLSGAGAAPPSSAPAGYAHVGVEASSRSGASGEARRDHHKQPAWHKQRRPWSKADEEALITLIDECNASWALMERWHADRFEYPRNQQAYRDKARNIKVDLLLRDAPLPPHFDGVVLGPKEIFRVERAGKNPNRSESDVRTDGTVTNTEYRG